MTDKPLILVVDDDAPILLLMRTLLREFGFETLTATSGSEALEAARARPPRLILLDKKMPGMSGEEVIRALRDDPALAATPVLILSGEPVDPGELARLGADDAVQKPFELGDLLAKIRAHVK